MDDNEDVGLPERMFEAGHEPKGARRINNYYNLKYIENIKKALTTAQLEMLKETQFRLIMEMSDHTFSTNFVHFLLQRQLITNKEFELWFIFAGKPMRYGIREFAVVTGLNCRKGATKSTTKKKTVKAKSRGSTSDTRSPLWRKMFGEADTANTNTILSILRRGRRHKDDDTRFKLALLLLAYGICCPTALPTTIKPEYVDMVEDTEAFLAFPWGRKSFKLTVKSIKARDPDKFIQQTISIQGFSHALLLVSITACPSIIDDPELKDLCDDEATAADIAECVAEMKLVVNIDYAKDVDNLQQAKVESCFGEGVAGLGANIEFAEEEADLRVDHMVQLINDGCQFDEVIWPGGLRAEETDDDAEPGDANNDSAETISSDSESEEEAADPKGKNPAVPKRRTRSSKQQTGETSNQAEPEARLTQQEMRTLMKDLSQEIIAKTEKLIKRYAKTIRVELSQEMQSKYDELVTMIKSQPPKSPSFNEPHFRDEFNVSSRGRHCSPRDGPAAEGGPHTHETSTEEENADVNQEKAQKEEPGRGEAEHESEENIEQTINEVVEKVNAAFGNSSMQQEPADQSSEQQPKETTEQESGTAETVQTKVAVPKKMALQKQPETASKKLKVATSSRETETASNSETVAVGTARKGHTNFSLGMDLTQQIREEEAKRLAEERQKSKEKERMVETQESNIRDTLGKSSTEKVASTSSQPPNFDLGISQPSTNPEASKGLEEKTATEGEQQEESSDTEPGTAEETINLRQNQDVEMREPFVVASSFPPVIDKEMPTTQEALDAGIIRLATSQREGVRKGKTCDQARNSEEAESGKTNEQELKEKKTEGTERDKEKYKSPKKNKSPVKEGDDIDRRYSRRPKASPKRFTPEVAKAKQPMNDEERSPPQQDEPARKKARTSKHLVGKFNPFASPNTKKMAKFVEQMSISSELWLCTGLQVDNTNFLRLLEAKTPLQIKDMEMLVSFAQMRRDKTPTSRFDFIMPKFVTEMKRHYNAFAKNEIKESFSFPTRCWNPVVSRPHWFTSVDELYIPYQVDGRFWVGLIVDLKGWEISIADSNIPEIPYPRLHEELYAFATMLPYFCNRNHLAGDNRVNETAPFIIGKIILKCNVTDAGLDGVATQVILEQFATRNVKDVELLTNEIIRCASLNYALACFFNLQAKQTKN